jgi:hypothetical protein
MVASRLSKHEQERIALEIVCELSMLVPRCLDIEPRRKPEGVHLIS